MRRTGGSPAEGTGEAVAWHDRSRDRAMPDPLTTRPRSCGFHLTCCTFPGPSLAATRALPVGHVCVRVRGQWEGGGGLRVGGKCGMVQAPWAGLGAHWGVLGQGTAASKSQGHAAWPPHNCNRMGAAVRRARLGGPCSLTAKRHRWCCLAGWVPHSHGRGALRVVGGVPGHAEHFPAL